MKVDASLILTSFVVGIIVSGVVQYWQPGSIHREYANKKAECERALPRNQQCEMVLVPSLKKDPDRTLSPGG